MKKIILLFALITSLPLFSQQNTFTINWEGTRVLETINNSVELPAFQKNEFSFDYDKGLLFVKQWKTQRPVSENSLSVSNVAYTSINKADLKDLDISTIPSQLKYRFLNSKARDINYAYFELSPIINDDGVLKKVTSFSIKYNFKSISERNSSSSSRAISNSVLRDGNWYRFYVEKSGVHRISKRFLESLGISLNNIDPRTIKIYGNGGRMLPLLNSEPYPIDLTENAIRLVGEEDGEFNNGDYILFYAEGPFGYNQDSNTNINLYTDKSYYYVNISSGLGKRISEFNQPAGTPTLNLSTYSEYQYHEIDEFNIVKLGRRWFGNRFSIENEQNFEFEFPNLVTTEPVRLRVYTAGVSEAPNTSMELTVNGSAITSFSYVPIDDPILADGEFYNNDINVNSSSINVGLNYDNNGNPSALAYVDYISLEGTSQLRYNGEQFHFKNYDVAQNTGIAQYTISNASNVSEVWDITDIYNVANIENTDSADTPLQIIMTL